MLNEISPQNRISLWESYKNVEGPIKGIRSQVAKILKEKDISLNELELIINEAKVSYPNSFSRMYKTWYNMLYMFVLANYRNDINQAIEELISSIKSELSNPTYIKVVKFDFTGERETGSTRLWIAIFNSKHQKQDTAKQLFLNIENGKVFFSLYNRPTGTHIEEINIADGEAFKADSLITLFKNNLAEVEADDASIKKIKKIQLLPTESIFKVSMGPNDINSETFNFLLSEQLVMVHKDTKPLGQSYETQGDIFTKKIKIGDYIYLCRGNKMILIGKINGESEAVEYDELGNEGWVQRSFEIIAQSVSDSTYTGEQKWWAPNFRSTCYPISNDEIDFANNIFFKPFFQTEFIKLISQTNVLLKTTDNTFNMPSLNTILYGPPGTGKTYHTITKAAEIIAGERFENRYEEAKTLYKEKLAEEQIEFVTFHQNYSYEDFVAGLRPNTNETNQLSFKEHKGIFYRISQKAKENWQDYREYQKGNKFKEPSFEEVLNEFLKPLAERDEPIVLQTLARNVTFKLFSINEKNFGLEKSSGSKEHTISMTTLKALYEGKREYNLQGLGVYYYPIIDKLKQVAATLRREITEVKLLNFVLIIDEINRANISRVFGELITLLEPDKRLGEKHELTLRLPGLPDEERFGVPPNLFIVATMNTADKSIALIDIAIRRRFVFEDMYPRPEIINATVPEAYRIFLISLNNSIKEKKGVDFTIGHAYFIADEQKPFDIIEVLNQKVIPLLNEYFYNQRNNLVWNLLSPLQTHLPNIEFVQDDFIGVKAKVA